MASRGCKETMSIVQKGEWPHAAWPPFPPFCGPQLSATPPSVLSPIPRFRTVGFLGFGRTARATLARLVPFGISDHYAASSIAIKQVNIDNIAFWHSDRL